ncbi:protein kinase [Streptomyces sp. NPDC058371]|uniref:serine/threonine-protein kinase n=1 Tax=Streptomyces sp. NPDC058371 TaxID=3346463 RepID=UPI003654D624
MGEVFAGRYELVDPVGRGGVGAVWRAWDHRRRRYVAAKVLQQSDAHSLLRFVREQALRIDHPHVLAPASWAADDDKVLFTMDLVAGGSLVHLVGDYGPLPAPFVCTLLDQLLAGLAAVHAEGVVHRDIKPANVLLEATGAARPRLRLSDFGIAMRLGEPRLTETNYVVGTPGYFAPEQMMGAEPDFPADLFAVGLVALYLLEGAKPDAKALIEYFAAHGTPGAPQSIPEPLWQVVATLLQPDPDARFRTATGARKALASAAELLPAPLVDDELVEVFDQVGPLPTGFGPAGPLRTSPGVSPSRSRLGAVSPSGGDSTPRLGGTGTSGGAAVAQTGTSSGTIPPRPRTAPPIPRSDDGTLPPHPGAVTATPPPPPPSSPPTPYPTGSAVPEPGAGSANPDTAHWHAAGTAPPYLDTGTTASRSAPDGTPPQPSPMSSPMSDTGSFHLPPPQVQSVTQPPQRTAPAGPSAPPAAPERPTPTPVHTPVFEPPIASPHASSPHEPAASNIAVQPHAFASTGSYTARTSQVPPQRRAVSRHRTRRPGPPATVAVPVLFLAVICFAVGFWALAQI